MKLIFQDEDIGVPLSCAINAADMDVNEIIDILDIVQIVSIVQS